MSDPRILDLDLAGFESGDPRRRAAVVDGMMQSMETAFVCLRNPFSTGFLDDVYDRMWRFFELPLEVKMRAFVHGASGESGYTPLANAEIAVGATARDHKEMVNFGTELPENHWLRHLFPHRYLGRRSLDEFVPGLDALIDRFHSEVAALQARACRVIAAGLHLDEHFFDGMLHEGPHLTRVVFYPSDAPEGAMGAAEHEDINITAFLPWATRPGLQLKLGEEWVDVMAPDGYGVFNKGDMMGRITNEVLGKGTHRVFPPDTGQSRLAIVQFNHPIPSTILAAVPSCVDERHPLRHPPIRADDYLLQRLHQIGQFGM